MKIITDENLYQPIIDFLIEQGHEVINVDTTGFQGHQTMKFIK